MQAVSAPRDDVAGRGEPGYHDEPTNLRDGGSDLVRDLGHADPGLGGRVPAAVAAPMYDHEELQAATERKRVLLDDAARATSFHRGGARHNRAAQVKGGTWWLHTHSSVIDVGCCVQNSESVGVYAFKCNNAACTNTAAATVVIMCMLALQTSLSFICLFWYDISMILILYLYIDQDSWSQSIVSLAPSARNRLDKG